jgi:hypothetical protein
MKLAFVLGTALALVSTTPAEAATYYLNRTIANGTAIGSITTDGTIGTLTNSNITGFSFELSLLGFTRTFTKTGAEYSIVGDALSATASSLLFDFSKTDNSYVLFSSGGSFMPNVYCLQANGACIDNAGPGEGLLVYNVSTRTPRAGNIEFANASAAVPEPATWGMMLLGFGMVGAGMRRRKLALVAA